MALPILLQKLFANSGVGPKLRPDIMPDSVLLNTAQTGFSSTEKAQARTNIGAADASDVVKLSEQTIEATDKEQVYKNLGLIQMFKELCLENGATQTEIDALE
jgi:hypothetical protein|nr:MAG TPA: hypothetical protein [Caudoviricetes sp.]